jgi:hypothetical protein
LGLIEAVDEIAATAVHTLAAVSAEEAEADTLADLPCADARSDGVDDADDLMTWNDRLAGIGPNTLGAEEIAATDPAAEHADAYVAGLRLDDLAVYKLELMLSGGLDGAICRHGDP